jgi:hypothetical protein
MWAQADMWRNKAVAVGRKRKGHDCASYFAIELDYWHTAVAVLVDIPRIFLLPSIYGDIK